METIQLDKNGEQIFFKLAAVGEDLENLMQELAHGDDKIRAKLSTLTETAVEFAQLEEMLKEHALEQVKSGRGVSVETFAPETVTVTNQAGETVEVPLDENGGLEVAIEPVRNFSNTNPLCYQLAAATGDILGVYPHRADAARALDKLNGYD